MDLTPIGCLLGASAAVLMGFSKTGLPGAAMPAVTLMAAAFPQDAQASVGAMLPLLLIGDVFAVTWFRRHAQWDRLWRLFPYVVLGVIPAYFLLSWLPGNALRPVLGWMVLVLLALELARHGLGWTRMARHWPFVAGTGFLAGFGTTIGNAGGPVMTLYLLSQGLVKEQFVGTCAWFFFLLNLSKVIPFGAAGMLTRETLGIGLALGPATLAGALAGIWLLPRISQRVFDAIMRLLTAVAGVWLIVG